MPDSWFRFERNEAGPSDVFLYGEIGNFGITASQFVKELNEYDDVRIRINSPGGSVDDGMAIYEALREHPHAVETKTDAAAYSIASVIAQAADPGKRTMAPRSRMLIHEASTFGGGRAVDFEQTAARLRETTKLIAGVYAEKSGKDADHFLALMADEKRYTADEAVAENLADRVTTNTDKRAFALAAGFDLSNFRNCADMQKELEEAAAELGVEPLEVPDGLEEVINKAILAAIPGIREAVEALLKETNKQPYQAPSDAARRELEERLAKVQL